MSNDLEYIYERVWISDFVLETKLTYAILDISGYFGRQKPLKVIMVIIIYKRNLDINRVSNSSMHLSI